MTAPVLDLPPVCNTGASDLTWDWYQATIRGDESALTSANAVMRALEPVTGPGGRWKAIPPLFGYGSGWQLLGVETGSVKVFAGGLGGTDVHVISTSAAAEVVAPILRAAWPNHTVSRADVAWDVDAPGSFDRLYQRVHGLARSNPRGKVSTSQAGDWIDRELGRTFYAGGQSSRLRVVVYEKGFEQRAKDPGCTASTDWTRVEWRLRPTSNQKAWLARATKEQALGLSAFGASVADAVLGTEVQAIGNLLRFASQDPAYWMARQYRSTIISLVELDPDDLRDRLVQLLDQTAPMAVPEECSADVR